MKNEQGTKKIYSGLSIVHVSPTYPPTLGGMEKVVQILAETQTKMGARVRVITSSTEGAVQKDPFKAKRLKSYIIANTTIMPGLFFELFRTSRDDVVHVHITQAFTPEMVWLASKIRKFSYIAHVHLDVPPSGPAGFLLKLYKPLVLRRVLHSATYVVVFTEEQKSVFRKKYRLSDTKVKAIVNGVEHKFYFEKKRSLPEKPKLLFVGRLGYQKNIPLLLNALNGISEQFDTVLIGNGELEQELKQQAQKLQLENVTFAGRKDGEELLSYFRDSDIFVLSSEREGMPLVLLEAMAMGLPIVATDVTGNRDVVVNGKNGLLVPLNDVSAFQNALIAIKSNAKRYTDMSRTAHEMAKSYTWEMVAGQFSELYKESAK